MRRMRSRKRESLRKLFLSELPVLTAAHGEGDFRQKSPKLKTRSKVVQIRLSTMISEITLNRRTGSGSDLAGSVHSTGVSGY